MSASNGNATNLNGVEEASTSAKDVHCFTKDSTESLLAATLVSDAVNGLHSDYKSDRKSLLFYMFYRQRLLSYLLYIVLATLHLIAAWDTLGSKKASDFTSVLTIEIICLTYLGARVLIRCLTLENDKFWSDAKNPIQVGALVLTAMDIIVFLILPTGHGVRWSAALRPLFIINSEECREVRRAIRNIRDTLPEVLNVLILFFLSLVTFTVIGLVLLQKQNIVIQGGPSAGKSYFTDFTDIIFDLYVLVTTANNPDLMMPAYNKNRWFAVYFVVFLIVNLYLFMNIILAVVYNNYRKHLKLEVKNLLRMKRESLSRAYDVLVNCNKEGRKSEAEGDGITLTQFQDLIDNFYDAKKIIRKDPNHAILAQVFWKLLTTEDKLKKAEFIHLSELLSMKITVKYAERNMTNTFEQFLPSVYFSTPSKCFRSCVKSRIFRYFFDALIVVNVVTVAVTLEERLKYFEWFLLSAFSFEILAKVYTFGAHSFCQRFWNLFDFVVIGTAIGFWLLMEFEVSDDIQQYLDLMLVLRILRLCKLIGTIERFRVVVKTIEALLPSILTYGTLLFVVFYAYAVIGVQVFHGLVRDANFFNCINDTIHCCSKLNTNTQLQYCTVNFNSLTNSFLFLFDLMVVNQWHVLAGGIESLMGTKWTRVYFISFHLICVIIVLNIFTAFVLEAFILEYNNLVTGQTSKSRLETQFLATKKRDNNLTTGDPSDVQYGIFIDSDHDYTSDDTLTPEEIIKKDRRFSIIHTTDSHTIKVDIMERKSVDVLLARMFENELLEEEEKENKSAMVI